MEHLKLKSICTKNTFFFLLLLIIIISNIYLIVQINEIKDKLYNIGYDTSNTVNWVNDIKDQINNIEDQINNIENYVNQ